MGDVKGATLSNIRTFTDLMVDGVKCGGDGMRTDRAGNLWAPVQRRLRLLGRRGVKSGRQADRPIRLPEVCANCTFAGPKR